MGKKAVLCWIVVVTVAGMFLLSSEDFLKVVILAAQTDATLADGKSDFTTTGNSDVVGQGLPGQPDDSLEGSPLGAAGDEKEQEGLDGEKEIGGGATGGRASADDKQQGGLGEWEELGAGGTTSWFSSVLDVFGVGPLRPPCTMLYYVACQRVSLVRLVKQVYVWILNWKEDTNFVVQVPPFKDRVPMWVGLVWWSTVIGFGVTMGMAIMLVIWGRRPRRCVCRGKRPSNLELRQRQRIKQEKEEQERAVQAVGVVLRDRTVAKQEEWGSRLQKYWFTKMQGLMHLVITIAPLSSNCFLDVKRYESELNDFLLGLRHAHLQPITYIKHVIDCGKEQVVIAQPFWSRGSLRDILYGENPTADWAKKYHGDGTPLSPEKVAKYGMQILEAMNYLYKQHSFNDVELRPLEHVHTGNIYIDDAGNCRLGGYENKLLGYKTRLHKSIWDCKCFADIDVIMFGHVMYEMVTGKVLSHLFPEEADYMSQGDGDPYKGCRDMLRFIFTRKEGKRLVHSIKQIRGKSFFASMRPHAVSKLELAKKSAVGEAKSLTSKAKAFSERQVKKLLPQHYDSHVPVITAPIVSKPLSPPVKSQLSVPKASRLSGESAVSRESATLFPTPSETDGITTVHPTESPPSKVHGARARSHSADRARKVSSEDSQSKKVAPLLQSEAGESSSLHRSPSVTSLPTESEMDKISLKKYLSSKVKVLKSGNK